MKAESLVPVILNGGWKFIPFHVILGVEEQSASTSLIKADWPSQYALWLHSALQICIGQIVTTILSHVPG